VGIGFRMRDMRSDPLFETIVLATRKHETVFQAKWIGSPSDRLAAAPKLGKPL
jgi:hypothetical protein